MIVVEPLSSSSLGLKGTSRSPRPLPWSIRIIIARTVDVALQGVVQHAACGRAIPSGLSTVGSRLRDLGNGMCSARKCRGSVLMNKKPNADTYWLTVAGVSFLVWNR
jgi:hypothetical protein